MRIGGIVIAVVLIAMTVTACGADAIGMPTDQGIEGRYVLRGPGTIRDCSDLHPGDERAECEAANQPWTRPMAEADLTIRDVEERPVATVRTDSEGAFRVELAVGDYLLCDAGCEGPVTVKAEEFTFYELSIAVP